MIGAGGQGWSYDPLQPEHVTYEAQKLTATQKRKLSQDLAKTKIKDFGIACAACRVLAIGDISPTRLPEELSILLNSDRLTYHKPFKSKIAWEKPQARKLLILHIEGCIAAQKAGTAKPSRPAALIYCQLHDAFDSVLEKKIKVGIAEGKKGADLLR